MNIVHTTHNELPQLDIDDVINISFICPEIAQDALATMIGKTGIDSGILVDGSWLVPTTNTKQAKELVKNHYLTYDGEEYEGKLECRLVNDLRDYLKDTWPNTEEHPIMPK